MVNSLGVIADKVTLRPGGQKFYKSPGPTSKFSIPDRCQDPHILGAIGQNIVTLGDLTPGICVSLHYGKFFIEYFGFPCRLWSHKIPTFIFRTGTIESAGIAQSV